MRNERFVYVFSEEDKDRLLSLGLNLIGSSVKTVGENDRQIVYVFENTDTLAFSSAGTNFVLTNSLTF